MAVLTATEASDFVVFLKVQSVMDAVWAREPQLFEKAAVLPEKAGVRFLAPGLPPAPATVLAVVQTQGVRRWLVLAASPHGSSSTELALGASTDELADAVVSTTRAARGHDLP